MHFQYLLEGPLDGNMTEGTRFWERSIGKHNGSGGVTTRNHMGADIALPKFSLGWLACIFVNNNLNTH